MLQARDFIFCRFRLTKNIHIIILSVAPEGGYYVKKTQVLVVACEEDNRSGARRSSLAIYKYGSNGPAYPTIQSVQDEATGVREYYPNLFLLLFTILAHISCASDSFPVPLQSFSLGRSFWFVSPAFWNEESTIFCR